MEADTSCNAMQANCVWAKYYSAAAFGTTV